MARATGLTLSQVADRAQMIRTWSLLLRAARRERYLIPNRPESSPLTEHTFILHPVEQGFSPPSPFLLAPVPRGAEAGRPTLLIPALAFQQKRVSDGLSLCSCEPLPTGTVGLHKDPVAILDFASLYPSIYR